MAISAGADHTVGLKSDGSVVAVGDNSYGQLNTTIVHSSDKRLKDNIEDISCDTATDWIMALNPVTYTYKADSELKVHHGLVYQEVQETAKELSMDNLALLQEFRGADKVVYGAIGYEELIADLIKVVQNHEKILRGEQND